jgi:hypothetical protein
MDVYNVSTKLTNNFLRKIRLLTLIVSTIVSTGFTMDHVNSDFKLFSTKTVNSWVEADKFGNPTSAVGYSNNTFRIFVNWQTNRAYCVVRNTQTAENYRIDGLLYSNIVKGLKVYYIQEDNGLCKMSFTREENGVSIYSYTHSVLTIFF